MSALRRHPWLLAGRTHFKLSVLPMAFRLLGKQIQLPSSGMAGVSVTRVAEPECVLIPEVHELARNQLLSRHEVQYPAAEVYRIEADAFGAELRVLDVGAVYLKDRYLLGCGLHASAAMLSTLRGGLRAKRDVSVLVLPWSHPWWSFGDFMMHILPFLCRIWATMTAEERANAVVGMSGISRNSFAFGFLQLIGIDREQVVDLSCEQITLKGGAGSDCIGSALRCLYRSPE